MGVSGVASILSCEWLLICIVILFCLTGTLTVFNKWFGSNMNLAIVCPPIAEGKSTLNSTGCSEPSGGREKDLKWVYFRGSIEKFILHCPCTKLTLGLDHIFHSPNEIRISHRTDYSIYLKGMIFN